MLSHLSLLRTPLSGCSPEAKFFLIRFVQRYGYQEEFVGHIKEVAKTFGVREDLISRVFDELVKSRYLTKRTVGGRRGRPSPHYGWGRTKECEPLPEKLLHVPLMDELLLVDLTGRSKSQRHKLTLSNRLLLAVLLDWSDSSGVVTGVGLTRLAALTGLNADRLSYQLRKLEYEGYLRPFVSGVTATTLFGASPGHHFVNLKHPGFGLGRRVGVLLVYSDGDTLSSIDTEAHSICELAERINRYPSRGPATIARASKYIPCDATFLTFAKLLAGQLLERRGQVFLQAKLNRYASYILNNHWKDLEQGAEKVEKARRTNEPFEAFHSPGLTTLIAQDCFGFKAKDVGPPIREVAEMRSSLLIFFAEAALWIAVKAWRCMNQSQTWWRDTGKLLDASFEEMEHVIFMSKGGRGGPVNMSIDSYCRDGRSGSSKCIYVNGARGRTYVLEDELQMEDMHRELYGLNVNKKYPAATSHERNKGPDHENCSSERSDAVHRPIPVHDL